MQTEKMNFISRISNVIRQPTAQPILSQHEYMTGYKLGFDTWAGTSCARKHAYVLEWIDGHTVTAEGFTHNLGKLENLPLANVEYAYDTQHHPQKQYYSFLSTKVKMD